MDAKATGRFIGELRREKGLTQKDLAERIGVTDKAVSRWETGKGLPDTALLKPLADVLEVSVSELLSGKRIGADQIKAQADQIILDSLDYSDPDRDLKRVLHFLLIGIVAALGCVLFALVVASFGNGPEKLSVGIGMYLCILIVTCTGIILTRLDHK